LRRLLRLLAGHALRQPSALPGETLSDSLGSAVLQLARDSAGIAAELLATPGSAAAGAGAAGAAEFGTQARRALLQHLDGTVLPQVRAFCASHRAAVAAFVAAQGAAEGSAAGAGAGSADAVAGADAVSSAAAVGSTQRVLVVLPKEHKLLAIMAQRAQARVAGADP
jgi:hypothetical protein